MDNWYLLGFFSFFAWTLDELALIPFPLSADELFSLLLQHTTTRRPDPHLEPPSFVCRYTLYFSNCAIAFYSVTKKTRQDYGKKQLII